MKPASGNFKVVGINKADGQVVCESLDTHETYLCGEQLDTYLDGMTMEECEQAYLSLPAKVSWEGILQFKPDSAMHQMTEREYKDAVMLALRMRMLSMEPVKEPADERPSKDRTLFGAMEASVMVEIEASEFFQNEETDINWKFCQERAHFSHRDACEFILHIGPKQGDGEDDDTPYWENYAEEMREYGCTEDFITAYLLAKDLGAVRVMFYC